MVCPPTTLMAAFAGAARGSSVLIGGRTATPSRPAPYRRYCRGDVADAGARAIIVGHSERRADHHETDAQVRAKARRPGVPG